MDIGIIGDGYYLGVGYGRVINNFDFSWKFVRVGFCYFFGGLRLIRFLLGRGFFGFFFDVLFGVFCIGRGGFRFLRISGRRGLVFIMNLCFYFLLRIINMDFGKYKEE